MIEKHTYNSANLVPGEMEFLSRLKNGIIGHQSPEEISKMIELPKKQARSSILGSIVFDVRGYLELSQTECMSLIPKLKFRDLSRDDILDLLVVRINSIKEGDFDLPEVIYEEFVFRIKYNNRLIDVDELYKRYWDYVLYTSRYYKHEYYADIVYDGIATTRKILKINDEDSTKIPTYKQEEIDKMILSYRNRL